MCMTIEYIDFLVYMEGRHILCAFVNLIPAEGRQMLGLNNYVSKESCTAHISNATTGDEYRNNNGGMDEDMRPQGTRIQPAI